MEQKMIGNILGWFVFVVLSGLFVWLALRAWRLNNRALKWAGTAVSGLFAVILAAASITILIGMVKYYTPRGIPVPDLSVPMTPENIARGEYIANSFCAGCHSQTRDLPMAGGVDLAKDLALPLGSFISANLTPAGPLKNWTDGEILNALRHGVGRDGRMLATMSSLRIRNMSDQDILAVIAYLRSQPPVTNDAANQPYKVNLLAMFLGGTGMLPEAAPVTGIVTAPPKNATKEYGEYLLSFQDCRECHGEDLKGGKEGQLTPIGWNLELVKKWTLEQFISTLRTGIDPNGYELSANMPWEPAGRMDNIELEAMYLYLTALE